MDTALAFVTSALLAVWGIWGDPPGWGWQPTRVTGPSGTSWPSASWTG